MAGYDTDPSEDVAGARTSAALVVGGATGIDRP